jgi:hypothetical protein
MRNLFFALMMCAVSAEAAYVSVTVTFTNRTMIGSNFVVNGATKRWTNAPLNTVDWLTTNSPAGSATNLQRFMAGNFPAYYSRLTTATNVVLSGTDLQWSIPDNATVADSCCAISTNSAPTTNFHAILVPWDTQPWSTNRTNDADELIYGLNKYALTNAFSTNAQALSNYVSTGSGAQTFGNKTLTNSTIAGGTLSTNVLTNTIRANINLAVITNITGFGGTLSNNVGTNWTRLNVDRLHATNAIVDALTNRILVSTQIVSYGAVKINTNANSGVAASILLDSVYSFFAAGNYVGIENVDTGQQMLRIEYGGNTVIPAPLVASNGVTAYTNALTGNNLTNSVIRGTNVWNGSVIYTPRANSGLANGFNSGIILGTNVYVQLSGPSGLYTNVGFAAEPSGSYHIVRLAMPAANVTIRNNDGLEATAENRITTGTGGELVLTNNPAWLKVIYDGTSSRWQVIDRSN